MLARLAAYLSLLSLPVCSLIFAGTARAAQQTPTPVMTDKEFEEAVPTLDAPIETIEDWQVQQQRADDMPTAELQAPLSPLETFDIEPLAAIVEDADYDDDDVGRRYSYGFVGLDVLSAPGLASSVQSRFKMLSVLEDGGGKAANIAVISARLTEDQDLLLRILSSEGYFDAKIVGSVEPQTDKSKPIIALLAVTPGKRYALGSIRFDAAAVQPSSLITTSFAPKIGDPIVAEDILSAEASIAVMLPQNGYPFAQVKQRDILLDPATATGDYTIPIDTGPRSRFGDVETTGNLAFDARHVAILRRFKKGDLYDSRKVDDLREALVATGLLSTAAVEAKPSGITAEDGAEYATLVVTQEAGPRRSLAISGGYSTGEGLRVEGSWTHRNLFPPEGALTIAGVGGTQEQGLSAVFRRSNAAKRDRTVEASIGISHSNFSAFDAYTGRISGRISYDSTPIWQKQFTYGFGFELLGTIEKDYVFALQRRDQQTYMIAALPAQIGFDTSDNLLNPTHGFRLTGKLSPEVSLGRGAQIYARAIVEGSTYFPVSSNLVLAGRARIASISGSSRANIAPSRRLYGGGGGSVRGFGFQQLGPKDPNSDPIGGRSLNEAAIEARYRFGNFGVVGFVDGGQVYTDSVPQFNNWRFGVGIGARVYTNFGPLRVDIATPLGRKAGESRVSVYVSIGQAF